jgi:hypothetical protein
MLRAHGCNTDLFHDNPNLNEMLKQATEALEEADRARSARRGGRDHAGVSAEREHQKLLAEARKRFPDTLGNVLYVFARAFSPRRADRGLSMVGPSPKRFGFGRCHPKWLP